MKVIIWIFVLLFISGCATKYQPESSTGGYNETQLGENIFNVTFKGNAMISKEQVFDYALLRSAEIALINGYSYFIITDSQNYTNNGTFTTPTTYNTTYQYSTYGNQMYGNSRTVASGGENINYSKPVTTNTIICYKDKPQINAIVLDAKFLINSIKLKYKMDN